MNSKDISYSFIHIIWKTLLSYMPTRMSYMTYILLQYKKKKRWRNNIVNKYKNISGHSQWNHYTCNWIECTS